MQTLAAIVESGLRTIDIETHLSRALAEDARHLGLERGAVVVEAVVAAGVGGIGRCLRVCQHAGDWIQSRCSVAIKDRTFDDFSMKRAMP